MGAPRAALVSVGDELLLGETVDTNQAWIGRELTRIGFSVVSGASVGDDPDAIRGALVRALHEAEVVILTGGLGPTPDDRTKEVVAQHLGRPLELRQDLYDRLERLFQRFGYETLPPSNRSQAEVPEGARCLTNPRGSAPGILIHASAEGDESGLPIVVLLPGIPREVEAIFGADLADYLAEQFARRLRPTVHRTVHTFGIPESVLSERVEDALPDDMGPVTLASLPRLAGVDLRLSAREVASDSAAAEWLDRIESALLDALQGNTFDSSRGDLVDPVVEALVREGKTLAVAESCTGGLLAARLTRWPGASRYFLGGVVCYADASKIRDLGVPEAQLEAEGAVSEAVVRSMVRGVAERFGSDAAVAITGVAGPSGGTDEKPVGTVWYAAMLDGEAEVRVSRFPGDRERVREWSTQAALHLLLGLLE